MSRSEWLPRVSVADMRPGTEFMDQEDRVLTVRRVLSLGDERARLETNRGVAIVGLGDTYPVVSIP